MSDINEVVESLRLSITSGNSVPVTRATVKADYLRALLADHARLRASHDRLLKAAQYLQSRVVETRGVRCMDEMHAAIDAAKAAQP